MGDNIRTPAGSATDPLIRTKHTGAQGIDDPHVQLLSFCDIDGNPISSIPTAPQLVTIVPTRPSIPNNASTLFLAANANRKAGSYLVNNTPYTFYLQYGASAVLNQGVPFQPDSVFKFDTTQALYAIQNSGGALNIDCFEAI